MNVLLFLIAEPLILAARRARRRRPVHDVGGPVPAAAAGDLLHRPLPRCPDAAGRHPGRVRRPGAAAPGRHQRHVLARAGGARAVVRRLRRRGLPRRHRLDPSLAGGQRRRPRALARSGDALRRPPAGHPPRRTAAAQRLRLAAEGHRAAVVDLRLRGAVRARRTTRPTTSTTRPIVVVAVLFVGADHPAGAVHRLDRPADDASRDGRERDERDRRAPHREPAQDLRRQGRAPRHRPGRGAARRDLPDRVVRLRQVHAAALPRPARGHRRRRDLLRGSRHLRPAGRRARRTPPDGHRLPGLQPVPAPVRARQRDPRAAQGARRRPGGAPRPGRSSC